MHIDNKLMRTGKLVILCTSAGGVVCSDFEAKTEHESAGRKRCLYWKTKLGNEAAVIDSKPTAIFPQNYRLFLA
jgi:hypothetical protein